MRFLGQLQLVYTDPVMIALNSPLWEELGTPEVPEILRKLTSAPDEGLWLELDHALLDQGDVYPGAYAAVPHLVELAILHPVPVQVEFWSLISYIASKSPGDLNRLPSDVRRDYLASLAKAKIHVLQAIQARAVDEDHTLVLVQALAAVSECYGPGRILRDTVRADELVERCPSCIANLKISLRGNGVLLRKSLPNADRGITEYLLPEPDHDPKPTFPSIEEITNQGCPIWIPQILSASGHLEAARKLGTLYQDARCPECGVSFPLMGELCKSATIDLDEAVEGQPRRESREAERSRLLAADRDAEGEFFRKLETLSKEDIVRALLLAAEIELYEGVFSADVLGNAEMSMAAARAWLMKPTEDNEEKARLAGSQALKLVAGAAATACSRMPRIATKTCVDAIMMLPSDLRDVAIARIQRELEPLS
jgi:hypothetical protein